MNDLPTSYNGSPSHVLSVTSGIGSTLHFSNVLRDGPFEFYLGAEVSPSLRALRYSYDEEQMSFVDLALTLYYKYIVRKAPANERPIDMLHDIIDDASPKSMLWAEAHSVLGVYYADDGRLERAVHHFQQAVDAYQLRGRDDGLVVCFTRHSMAMLEHGMHRAAARSLLKAESFASKIDRPVYRQVCQLTRLQGMFYEGRLQQAAKGARELSESNNLGAGLGARLIALQYAGHVEAGNEHSSEEYWQLLLHSAHERAPRGLIATKTRVRYLLKKQQFSDAAEVILSFLQDAPLISTRCKRGLLNDLMTHEAIGGLPHPLMSLFEGWLQSVDVETQQDPSIDVNLVCHRGDV